MTNHPHQTDYKRLKETELSKKVSIFQTNRHQDLNSLLSHPKVQGTTSITMEQIHSANTAILAATHSATILQTDSLISQQPQTTLIVKTADCLPIVITNLTDLIAVIHAGRKGTEQLITQHTLQKITQLTNRHLSISFGPHICRDCYQIDRDLDIHYDLIAENKAQIKSILDLHSYTLNISNWCTVCNNDKFFSYRKDKPLNGKTNYTAVSLF